MVVSYLCFNLFRCPPKWLTSLFNLARHILVWQHRCPVLSPDGTPFLEINNSQTCTARYIVIQSVITPQACLERYIIIQSLFSPHACTARHIIIQSVLSLQNCTARYIMIQSVFSPRASTAVMLWGFVHWQDRNLASSNKKLSSKLGSTDNLYSWGLRFNCQPRDWLSWS